MSTLRYIIIDRTTNEILSDNLKFEDMPELLCALQAYYPTHTIEVGFYKLERRPHKSNREMFVEQWYALLDELIENIER